MIYKVYTEEQLGAYQRLRDETASIRSYVDLARRCLSDVSSFPAVSEESVRSAEDQMQVTFPQELKDFWSVSNGLDWHGTPLVMSIETLLSENQGYRDGDLCDFYMPFDSLLVFGRTSLGDLFFYPIQWNKRVRETIFLLDHQTDDRGYFAGDLRELFISLAIGKY